MTEARQPALIHALLQADLYPHPVTALRLIETHISWVVLTGHFAYKLKKPLNLGFLDFSTLEKRRKACEEELRLNARLAPGLYLAVIRISGTPGNPCLDGDGPAIEYAVKMHEFAQAHQLDRVILSPEPDPEDLDKLFRHFGVRLAGFHLGLPAAQADTPYGDPKRIAQDARDNFTALAPFESDAAVAALLRRLRSWTETSLANVTELLRKRKAGGLVRECHGDLHLRNLVLHDNQIVPFDCIEFSPELRWIDVMSDVAFLFMDLVHHQRERLAYNFLNAWLSASGDFEALRLLWFYAVYRAMVRAKVTGIELLQHGWPDIPGKPVPDQGFRKLTAHLEHALALAGRGRPLMVITHGVSGSGKTWVAARLAGELGAIHMRSDVERKRLFGMTADARSSAADKPALYGRAASEQTYARLLALAETTLNAGFPVLVDATFLETRYRDQFAAEARRLGIPFVILHCEASTETLRARVAKRDKLAADASEADLTVLARQLSAAEPFESRETRHVVKLATDADIDFRQLLAQIEAFLPEPELFAPQ